MSDPASKPTVAVLERNRAVGQRIARIMSSASGLQEVPVCETLAELRARLSAQPLLIGCDAADVAPVLEWMSGRHPRMGLIVWTSGSTEPVLKAALKEPRLSSIIGWPSFASMPRPWEISLALRRALRPRALPPRLSDLLAWGATLVKWRPRTSEDRDRTVADVARWAKRAGAPPRTAERLAALAHELLMNAMYDAPVDRHGRHRYALDRRRDLALEDTEVPTLRLGTDGERIALQVHDPFGGLRRHHVFEGITRGLSARGIDGARDEVLDTSRGGAGLGMLKIYASGTALVIDVAPRASTMITSFYDLDVSPREFRSMPASLHFFEQSTPSLVTLERKAG